MLDNKYLKVFGLDNNFSLDELEGKYKKLLKEFDPENIEDDLKLMFSEEYVKIQEAYQILLKYHHKQEKFGQTKSGNKPSSPKVRNKKNKQKEIVLGTSLLLVLFIGAFIAYNYLTKNPPPTPPETCELVLKDNSFHENDVVSTKDAEEIYNCFINGSIKVDKIKYTLIKEVKIQKKEDGIRSIVKDNYILKNLISSLENANFSNRSKLVIEAIEKVRNYNKLISDKGLKGEHHTWIWQYDKLKYIRNKDKKKGRKEMDKRFYKSQKEHIFNFFTETNPIPKSVLEDITIYLNEFDDEKKDKKEEKKEEKKEDKKEEKKEDKKEEKKEEKKEDKKEKKKEEKKEEKKEDKKEKASLVKLIPGCWSLKHQWPCNTGEWNDGEFCFKSNGIMNSSTGKWIWDLNGNNISIRNENGTIYTGVYRNGVITGTMISHTGSNGCFKLNK